MTHVHICSRFTINKISWIFHLDNTVITNPKYFRLIWRSDDISFSSSFVNNKRIGAHLYGKLYLWNFSRPKENGVDSHQHAEHPAKRLHSMASPGSSSSRISPTGGAPYSAFHGGPIRYVHSSITLIFRILIRTKLEIF